VIRSAPPDPDVTLSGGPRCLPVGNYWVRRSSLGEPIVWPEFSVFLAGTGSSLRRLSPGGHLTSGSVNRGVP
jgi:hypothetical protein